MAQRVVYELLDDLDKTPATETVKFGLDGRTFTVDLNDSHAKELRLFLKPYVEAGRKAQRSRVADVRKAEDFDPAAVRAWAASNGIDVSKRGRVPATVVEKYKAAGY
jgi:hypothetical protein